MNILERIYTELYSLLLKTLALVILGIFHIELFLGLIVISTIVYVLFRAILGV